MSHTEYHSQSDSHGSHIPNQSFQNLNHKNPRKPLIILGVIAVLSAAAALGLLYFVPTEISVVQTNPTLYQYESLTKADLRVTNRSMLGRECEVTNYRIDDTYLADGTNVLTITTAQLSTWHWDRLVEMDDKVLQAQVTVSPICVDHIEATYLDGTVYMGDELKAGLIQITYVYTDGHTAVRGMNVSTASADAAQKTNSAGTGEATLCITDATEYVQQDVYTVQVTQDDDCYETTLEPEPVRLVSITPRAEYGWFIDDTYDPVDYVGLYEDGTEITMKVNDFPDGSGVYLESLTHPEEITSGADAAPILAAANHLTLTYRGLTYETDIEAVEKIMTSAEVVLTGDFRVYEQVDYSRVSFHLRFEDGTEQEVTTEDGHLWIENAERELVFGTNTFAASYRGQAFTFEIEGTEQEITAVRPLGVTAYIGECLSYYPVEITYADGTTRTVTEYTPMDTGRALVYGANAYSIYYHGQDYVFTVTPTYRPITKAVANVSDDLLADDVLTCTITVTYDNGRTKNINWSDVAITSGSRTLTAGVNTITFAYEEQTLSVTASAYPNTRARRAWRELRSAYTGAAYRYVSDSTFVTVNRYYVTDASAGLSGLMATSLPAGADADKTGTYLLTHIIVNDGSQLRAGLSYGTFGGTREKPSAASVREDWVVGTNGSYFSYEDGQPYCAGLFIKNGEWKRGTETDGGEFCLTADGRLFTPDVGLTTSDLLAMGVTDVFGTLLPVLIKNGGKCSDGTATYNASYPRTGWGMVAPGEYYIITASDGSYNNGMSLEAMQDIFYALGCVEARALDGGGSSSLVLNDTLLNSPAAGSERPVVDFLYVVD